MKRLVMAGAAAVLMAMAGCTSPEAVMNQTQDPIKGTAAEGRPQVALREYTPEQVVQVLRELRDERGASPAQVLDHKTIQAQSDASANSPLVKALTPEVTPESCAPLVNFAPTMEEGLVMGTSVFSDPKMQMMISAAVDARAGHGHRADANDSAVNQCGDLTMKLGGQEIKMSMERVSLEIDAENSLAIEALGQAAGNQIHMVSFTANSGSVLISGAAFSSEDFDEAATLKSLAGMAQDALDRFADLPIDGSSASENPVNSGASPNTDAANTLRDAAVGSWAGPVTGDSSSYTVEVVIQQTPTGLSAEVEYPELRCKASWKEAAANGSSISFAENLVSGRCEDNVKVTMTQDSGTWKATFSSKSGLSIQSVLRPR